jgi:glutathione S-transferase
MQNANYALIFVQFGHLLKENSMSDKIIFYYNPMSRARIIHWMLEETGVDYEIKLIDFKKGENKSPEFLKMNPMGKLPVIVHHNTVITEGAAICCYLADAFPKAGLAPALNDPARGTYFRWMFFATNCVEPALVDKSFPHVAPPGASRLGYGTYEETVNTLEKAVSNGFLTGKFSAADLYVSSLIGWGMMTKELESRAAFQSYVKLCSNRPGFERFNEQAGKLG